MIFEAQEFGHQLVIFGADPKVGLRAIIALHSTDLGPALGGCRMWPYASEQAALTDVLRLSRGMTYKAALANLPLGGGKSVMIGDANVDKSPALFRAMGAFVERLNGQYIIAEDVGTSVEDMDYIRETTRHVVGRPLNHGGSGDPSIFTALGTLKGMHQAAIQVFGSPSLQSKRIIIQGLGHVGQHLCRLLAEEGAELLVYDPQQSALDAAVRTYGAQALTADEVYTTSADIFAPCALGAILNSTTIPHLKVRIIAGCANNQLQTPQDGIDLMNYGILYTPDYVINAGGLINVSYEGPAYDAQKAMDHLDIIPQTLQRIFDMAQSEKICTSHAADLLAQEKVAAGPDHRKLPLG